MLNFKIEFYLKLIFLISLTSVISAYFIEYVLGHQPCNLCIIERIPYVLSLIIILISFKFKINKKIFNYFTNFYIHIFINCLNISFWNRTRFFSRIFNM